MLSPPSRPQRHEASLRMHSFCSLSRICWVFNGSSMQLLTSCPSYGGRYTRYNGRRLVWFCMYTREHMSSSGVPPTSWFQRQSDVLWSCRLVRFVVHSCTRFAFLSVVSHVLWMLAWLWKPTERLVCCLCALWCPSCAALISICVTECVAFLCGLFRYESKDVGAPRLG